MYKTYDIINDVKSIKTALGTVSKVTEVAYTTVAGSTIKRIKMAKDGIKSLGKKMNLFTSNKKHDEI